MVKQTKRLPVFLISLSVIIFVLFFAFGPAGATASANAAQREVNGAWNMATQLGEFNYQTRLEQTVQPLPTLANAGLGSRTKYLYIEGHNNLENNEMSMRIWTDGQSPLNDKNALEISVKDGRTLGRVGEGAWEEVDNISQLIAPAQDNLGFLAAAQNIIATGQESRAGISFDRYSFDIDGPAFARYMQKQMEAELARKGALPPGMQLNMSDNYAEMSGKGEFWVDERGLPLRLVTDITLPPDANEQTSVHITTDFSDWNQSLAARATTWYGRLTLEAPVMIRQNAIGLAVVIGSLGLLLAAFLLLRRIGWKRFFRTTIILIIPIIVFEPLLKPLSAKAAFVRFNEFTGQQHLKAAAEDAPLTGNAVQNAAAAGFNPQQNPLAAFNTNGQPDLLAGNPLQTTTTDEVDTDGDGLSDGTEDLICTDKNDPDTDHDGLSDGEELDPNTPLTNPCASDTDGDGLSDGVELLQLGTDPTDIDTDGDLISDKTEVQGFTGPDGQLHYLNPVVADTNLDSRNDGFECKALVDIQPGEAGAQDKFISGPKPTPATTCPDLDGDGVVDVLDRDDDGDGVPDNVDSDYATVVTGGKKDPTTCVNDYDCMLGIKGDKFNLQLSDYKPNLPLLVDFQIRPENPDHLHYLMHVLDWPDNDNQGQITTGNGNTFGDSGRDANGDLRLFPLLEVKIPSENFTYPTLPKLDTAPAIITATTPITSWLDTSLFEDYGIVVRKSDAASGDLLAYVPLNMVADPISGDPVAFTGRMAYKPDTTTWGNNHTVRLVWMVEVINADGESQFVHVYEDQWLLTGLTVREDHGAEVAISYEDPAFAQAQTGYDPTTYTEQNLWRLADGLANSFMVGRTDSNGNRDMTVAEIARRWDKTTNAGNGLNDGDDALWGIPKNALFVHTDTFTHQGELGRIPSEINQILTDTFTTVASQGVVTATVVNIAREEQVRLAGLTSTGVQTATTGSVSFQGIEKDYYVASQLAAYKYQGGWKPFDANEYWATYFRPRLQPDLDQAHLALLGSDATTKTRLGFFAYAYGVFATQFAGLNNLVQRGLTVYKNLPSVPDGVLAVNILGSPVTPTNVGYFATTVVRYVNIGAGWIYTNESIPIPKFSAPNDLKLAMNKLKITGVKELNEILKKVKSGPVVNALDQYKRLNYWQRLIVDDKFTSNHLASVADGYSSGKTMAFLQGEIYTKIEKEVYTGHGIHPAGDTLPHIPYYKKYKTTRLNKIAAAQLGLQGAILLTGIFLGSFYGTGKDLGSAANITFQSINAISESMTIFQSSRQFIAAAKGIEDSIGYLDRAIQASKLLGSQISEMTRITVSIGTVLQIGVAVGLFIGLAVSSGLDLTSRLGARAVVDLIGAISLAAIMFALNLIPGIGVILVAIIGLIDSVLAIVCAASEDAKPRSVICQGISGALSILIGSVFYSFQTVVDPTNDNLVTTGNPSFSLTDEAKGFTVGNSLNITMPVTATLYKNGVNSLSSLFSPGFFSDENAKKSTFDFAITNSDTDRPVTVGSNQYTWEDLDKNRKLSEPDFRGQTIATGVAPLTTAGANTLVENAYFSTSYAIPGIECKATVACVDYTEQQTFNVKLADLAFDVLPANLDQFLNMTSVGSDGGYSFAWGQNGGLPFPVLRDADGDGLASKAKGGLDPDDSRADTDGDHLSDFFELQNNLNPNKADTDGDGLSDYDELYYGTDPTRADTDNDGLQDGDEILGWTTSYGNGQITQVWSDPLLADADQDGYIDSVEKAYGFNPNIPDTGDILQVDTGVEEWVDVPAVAPCSTLTINTLTVLEAVRDKNEPLEYNSAEIAILIDNRRVWFSEGLVNGSVSNINVSFPFCNGQAVVELYEIDQGAWSDDPIGDPLVINAGDAGNTVTLESSRQGSKVSLTYSMTGYNNATVPILVPSDGYVAPGKDVNVVTTVHNALQVRNALGLYSLQTPATWPAANITDQPFILPPDQTETFRGSTRVPSNLSTSGRYAVTSSAGAFFDPNLHPANSVTQAYTPTVHITFDDADASNGSYYNVAPGGSAVVGNVSGRNPIRDANGAFNQAAEFTRIGYNGYNQFEPQWGDALHVTDNANDSLALHGGSFTLASWIKRPEISSAGAIAGYMPALDRKDAYPTLYVNGPEIGLYFGDGQTVCQVETNNQPLVVNQWQHVAATFDATTEQVKIFLDGNNIYERQCSEKPTQQSQFWIGRATVADQIRYDRIYIEKNGVTGKQNFRLESVRGTPQGILWSQEGVGDNVGYSINVTVTLFTDPAQENYDGGFSVQAYNKKNLNTKYNIIDNGQFSNSFVQGNGFNDSHDDVATMDELRTGSYDLSWEDPGFSRCDGNGCATIYITHLNKSMHFYQASLDDFRLYKEAVSEEGIRDIYLSADTTLKLPLDEAPGAYTQYDNSGNRNDGYCLGTECPKAGLPGRIGRAIEFDGSNDLVNLPKVSDLRLNSDKWTIAGWVKPAGPNGIILASAGQFPDLQVGISNLKPRIVFGNNSFVVANPIPLRKWTHLAFVRDGTNITIYVNGVAKGTWATSAGVLADGPVYLGGNLNLLYTVDAYEGLLDQVTIRPAALDQPAIQSLIDEAPLVYVPFDDPAGSTSFKDEARLVSYSCGSTATCPTAGQDGQQYGSIRFDGNDYLRLSGAQPPLDSDWTAAIWVKLDGLKNGNQVILRDVGGYNLARIYINPEGYIYSGACNGGALTPSTNKIIPGVWNHIALSYNHAQDTAGLYINGSLDNEMSTPTSCKTSSSTLLEIGRGGAGFEGEMDELTLYGAALGADELRDIFNYQVAWFDSSDTASLFVDVDKPTVALASTGVQQGDNPNIIITASDRQQAGTDYSGVALVEYQVDGGGWQKAKRDGQVWGFTLDTSTKGSGSYTIQMRATDNVGNVSAVSTGSVQVDAEGPAVSLSAAMAIDDDTVELSGTAGDNNGISDVRLKILDHDGLPAGDQVNAALSGAGNSVSWLANYTTTLPLYGTYDVQMLAIDKPGNVTTDTASITVDQTPPTAFLTDIGSTEGVMAGIDSNLPVIRGHATDIPFLPNESVSLQFEETAAPFYDGSPNRNHATCDSNCPAVVSGQTGQAASFDGVSDRLAINNANGLFDSGLDITGTVSFAAWVQPASLSGEQVIFGRGADANNQVFLRLKDGQYQAGVIQAGSSYLAAYAIPSGDLNQWVHLAGVYNGSEWLLYRNGVIVSREDAPVGSIVSGDNWTIGGAAFGGSYFNGLIDELFLYPGQVPMNTIAAMADPVDSSAVSMVEVGLLHLQYRDTPSQTDWYPATLDQPNTLYTTWSLQLPAGIEGPYRLSLRTTDADGHVNLQQDIWSGEIDTLAPTATLSYWDEQPGRGAFYACDVSDYNLTLDGISCPIPGNKALSILEYQDAPWFVDVYSPTRKLERAATDGGRWLNTKNRSPELTACDLYGNCTTVMPVPVSTSPLTTTVRIEQPAAESGFDDASASIVVSGFVTAQNYPVTLDVQVDGASIYNQTWTAPTAPVENWSTNWTPPGTGTYTLSATITDGSGNTANDTDNGLGITILPQQIFVSDQPPSVAIDSSATTLSSADFLPDGTVFISGQASDAVGVKMVEARFDSAPWQLMSSNNGTWSGSLPYPGNTVADGDTFTLEVRATNLVGLTTTVSDTVTADFVPPAPFKATLSYLDNGNQVSVGLNETVSAVSNPTLQVDWTATSDPGGIGDYAVSWFNIESDGSLTELFTETTAGTSSSYAGSEGQRILVEITATDTAGNEQVATAGPIYLDDSLTPAYIDMAEFGRGNQPYRNWTSDICNVLGSDNRRANLSTTISGIGAQSFYATWNADGLRLAWQGANWDVDGDLFIYLDTASGGGERLYNPYPATANDTIILLPPGMAADYAIWIQDAHTASLLSWNGSAWVDSGQAFTFVHENNLPRPQSDLFVPFASLGNPSTLSMVAVASEEDALRLWAALPSSNSLNSELVVPGADSRPAHLFSLTQAYSFSNLGSGICPSSGNNYPMLSVKAHSDVDVIAYSQLSDNLFFVMPDTLSNLRDWSSAVNDLCATAGDAPLCDRALIGNSIPAALDFDARSALDGVVSLNHQAIGPNQTVDIAVDIVNQGSTPLNGLEAAVTVSGPLQLQSSPTVSVPTTAAGETASLTITVQATSNPADKWGSVDVVLYDGVNGSANKPLEWVFVDVEVDTGAPELVMLDPSQVTFNSANQRRLFGTYVDQSPIQTVTFESNQSCVNESDVYGIWECSSAGPTASGTAGINATDIYGAQSTNATSPMIPNIQDQTAPSLTLGLESQAIFDDNILSSSETRLNGTVTDDHSTATVEVCQVINGEERCEPATVQSTNANSVSSFNYADQQPAGLPIPSCSSPLVRSFTVNDSFSIADLDVGLNLAHPFRNDVLVTLTSAQGTAIEIVSGGTGAANYSLLIDDTATAALSTDYRDHDWKQLFSNARRPANEMITSLSTEDPRGTWTLSICDQYPAADSGTYYASELFFSARDKVAAASDKWTYDLTLPTNQELSNQILRIYAIDEAGNRSAPLEYTYTLDTRGPEVTFDTFFSGQVTDASGVKFMTIKYHGPNGETVEDEITLNGSDWSYPAGLSFKQDELYAIYVEATDNAGNNSSINVYDYFAGNNPPQASDDSYVTDEDTFFFANASQGVLANDSDPDGDRITAVLASGPSKGVLILNGDGSFSFDPNGEFDDLRPGEYENVTFTYQASDSRALSAPATVTIRVDGVNDPPKANADNATTDEDTPISIDVLANDIDPEGQPLSIGTFDQEALVFSSTVDLITGTAGLVTPTIGLNELTFDPNGDFETMTDGDSSFVRFYYEVVDAYGLSSPASVSVNVIGVNDAPVFLNGPYNRQVQYSDYITPTTITVYDVDADSLSLSQVGLPDGLSFVDQGCDDGIRPSTCTALITGTLQVPAGTYTATISASDGLTTTNQTFTVNVAPEDTKLAFDGNNPVAVQVTAPGSDASVPFDMVVYVEELEPDLAAYLGAPGNINLARVSMVLEPVGPGSPVTGACLPTPVDPVTGYADVLTVTCSFADVPVNTYSIALLVDGGYYAGNNEDVLVVYDPSLGFTTGGGWFYWPGSEDPNNNYPGDKTNFGYTMKYNKKGTNVQGSLLLIRHMPDDSIYRLKSNSLAGLSIGDMGSFGWASFAGKGTYLEPGWPDPIGNHTFLFYVEDHNDPGNGVDKVWVEVRDKDDVVIGAMSMTRPGAGNAVEINGGNIVVPHSGG